MLASLMMSYRPVPPSPAPLSKGFGPDPCAAPSIEPAGSSKKKADFFSRTLLEDPLQRRVFVCDLNLQLERQQCFVSDDGDEWKTLKEGIVNVVGFDLKLNRLVGIYQTDFNADNQVPRNGD